jgi:hypothetical protein
LLHTHFAQHRVHHSAQAELRDLDPDDDAVFQQWFSPTQNTPQVLTIIFTVAPVLPTPVPNEWRAERVQPNAHAPPEFTTLPARSPPV